jgi:hypothetical protein
MNKYDEIINIKHFDPVNHPRMSMENRAAQFSAFAALTGYSESVKETARLTKDVVMLSEDRKSVIDMKLQLIEEYLKEKPEITITYFIKDSKKSGGVYQDYTGIIRRIDKVNKKIIFYDKKVISLNDILDIKASFIKEDN